MPINWIDDQVMLAHIDNSFDVEVVPEPIKITSKDIDRSGTERIGQNRYESTLDLEHVDRIARWARRGGPIPRIIVFSSNGSKKVIVAEGNHRVAAILDDLGEPHVEAHLLRGEEQVAEQIALSANTHHGKGVMDNPAYVALALRRAHDLGNSFIKIAEQYGLSEERVRALVRRDEAEERLERLLPDRKGKVKDGTLDLLVNLEDKHIQLMGDSFLDSHKKDQQEAIARINAMPSADRDHEAEQMAAVLRDRLEAKTKTTAKTSKASSKLQDALTRLASVPGDPIAAFFQSTDAQKAKMVDQIKRSLPGLQRILQVVEKNQAA